MYWVLDDKTIDILLYLDILWFKQHDETKFNRNKWLRKVNYVFADVTLLFCYLIQ